MKQLLRACFVGSGDNAGRIYENFLALRDSGLGFDFPEDVVLWNFIKDFAARFHHVPDVATLQTHFKQAKEQTILERIMELNRLESVLTRGDFAAHLETQAEDRRIKQVGDLLREASTVLQTGIEVKDQNGKSAGRIKGPIDALRFVFDRSHDIVTPLGASRLSGDVTSDGDDAKAEYERIESDPLHGVGQQSGIKQMDTVLNGAKKFELWIHAAFTGGLKSTLALNWAYNQAVWYGKDVLFFSLEMPYSQCRRILYAIHSYHPKFKALRFQMGLQDEPNADVGLPYEAIRDGKLDEVHANAKRFYFEYVIPDLNRHVVVPEDDSPVPKDCDYGRLFIEVADPDKPDFQVTDLRARADLIYSKTRFKMIFVDHAGLMAPRKWVSSTTDRLNEVLRDLKKLAMSFNRGEGMAVVALFQIGREGFKSALKVKEKTGKARFELVHLSYANEAERSGDVVTTTWVDDDLRKANRVQVQCLKARDSAPFEMFTARIEWPYRVIRTCFDVDMSPAQKAEQGERIEKLVASLG